MVKIGLQIKFQECYNTNKGLVCMKRTIFCIDLKSFYASCECLLINKDPLKTPLVVASKTQGPGAITLAVTPYLKNLGIKSRGRIYEIPSHLKYIHIHPKMSYYVEKSKEVINVFLDFVNQKDLHVYSVDESFLDVTNYLKYYNLNDEELASKILKTIKEKTGLLAVCGIGSNLFIAKTAMDIDAKHSSNNIANWTDAEAKIKIKKIKKLTDMWGIGKNMAKRLTSIQIFSIKDLAESDPEYLNSKLGIIGLELWNHANGIDEAIISDDEYYSKNISYANSQILFKDYNKDNIKIIIEETINLLAKRLRQNNKSCKKLSLGIGYSYDVNQSFYKSITFDNYTRDKKVLYEYALFLLKKNIEDYPIRKLSISLGTIKSINKRQLNLFEENNSTKKEYKIDKKIDEIQNKYGKNAILSASSLLLDSTIINRNGKLGGHSA